ncbi:MULTISPECIES: DUF935 domain-containing protein [unclassified Rhodococcus (in: high G+C Gram-positive bacteria)]|uniref:DUF935 domain-containing protein n=1 Tax=unclassified Rhodococcus (in: high G+C Gram-positive bacteria) TaxID=192944 RepID=UPI00211AAC2D|nr:MULTISPECIES: DUF935 domain-containing protein [unclassified Rhodococcus (in: high G+C Gram-positive bacteria)]
MTAPAKTMPVAKPTTIGYANANGHMTGGSYWDVEVEETPELRWPLASRVYEQMKRQDAQIKSVLRAVSLPVMRTGWRLDPNGSDPEVYEHVSQDLGLPIHGMEPKPRGRTKGRFSWQEHLQNALLSIQYGHMFFEQEYAVDETTGLLRLRKLGPRMPRTISAINVARDGGLVSIEQYDADKPIPVTQLVAYVYEKEGADWLGNSLLRPAYKNWLLKDRLLRVQAQTIERNGMGVPVYEAGERDEQAQLDKGEDIARSYRSGDASGAALPWKARLRLLGVEGNLPDAQPAINYHDAQIGRAVLAHFLNLGDKTGSWALGSTFADFFVMSLQTLADALCETANQHIVEDLVDLNWGPEVAAPRIVFDEIGSRHDAVAPALKMLVDGGLLDPDEAIKAAVRQAYGLPLGSGSPATPAPEPAPEEVTT